MNTPMSFNRWNYVNGNPVNLADPTGNEPHPFTGNGYAEGTSIIHTALFQTWSATGEEIVYDFETMERGKFHFEGKTNSEEKLSIGWCTNVLSVGRAPYSSVIIGFDSVADGGGIKNDYSDLAFSLQMDISAPILLGLGGLGFGGVYFQTAGRPEFIDIPDVAGLAFFHKEISAGGVLDIPISLAGFTTNYTLTEYNEYKNVDDMIRDIRQGDKSPNGAGDPINWFWREMAIKQLKSYRRDKEVIE
jgi:hypothetical protein